VVERGLHRLSICNFKTKETTEPYLEGTRKNKRFFVSHDKNIESLGKTKQIKVTKEQKELFQKRDESKNF